MRPSSVPTRCSVLGSLTAAKMPISASMIESFTPSKNGLNSFGPSGRLCGCSYEPVDVRRSAEYGVKIADASDGSRRSVHACSRLPEDGLSSILRGTVKRISVCVFGAGMTRTSRGLRIGFASRIDERQPDSYAAVGAGQRRDCKSMTINFSAE